MRHITLIGIVISLALLFVSTTVYPGGSQYDDHSVGFSWRHNYLSNLLNPVAGNGAANPAQAWAVSGVLFLCASVAVFFVRLSKKIPHKSAANIIRYAGAGSMLTGVLAATPLHDLSVSVSGTLLMLSLFYATVFIFRTNQRWLKALSVLFLVLLYGTAFIYFTQIGLAFLPVMQKLYMLVAIGWVLALDYRVKASDFNL